MEAAQRAPVRDLTDPEQNRAVLDSADAIGRGEEPGTAHGPAVAAEAAAVARSRQRLAALGAPVHLSVVWAMYGETGRMARRGEHPHGEDFVRAKVAQLDWLTRDLPGVTWSITAVDDGCPDRPSSAEVMAGIAAAEGYPEHGHRGVRVLRLADSIDGLRPGAPRRRGLAARHPGAAARPARALAGPVGAISPAFARLTSTDQSRKGGSILLGLAAALQQGAPDGAARHVVCYTDADLSANVAQLGALAPPLVTGGAAAALGQRYGMPDAVLVKPDGPTTEPQSTGGKPDKLIVLFRHFVRALLVPDLAHVLDTQAGFKAFDAAALGPVLPGMTSFNETFDVELLIHLAQRHGADGLAVVPIVFTEDFAATNFPSVDPGARHLAMIHQVVDLYDRFVAPAAPATGEAAELLDLVRGLDLDGYVRIIEGLRAADPGDPTLFDRRWPVARLRALSSR